MVNFLNRFRKERRDQGVKSDSIRELRGEEESRHRTRKSSPGGLTLSFPDKVGKRPEAGVAVCHERDLLKEKRSRDLQQKRKRREKAEDEEARR